MHLASAFAATAAERPGHTFVVGPGGSTTTYGEAAGIVGALAGRLDGALGRLGGAVAGPPLAVWLDEGPEALFACLAACAGGRAFCPLDAGLPWRRAQAMLARAGVTAAVVTAALAQKLAADLPPGAVEEVPGAPGVRRVGGGGAEGGGGLHLIIYEVLRAPTAAGPGGIDPAANPPPPGWCGRAPDAAVRCGGEADARGGVGRGEGEFEPGALCYVQHTSGSTGFPKAVRCSNEQVLAYAAGRCAEENITAASRVLMASSVMFDPWQGDLGTACVSGCTLVAPSRQDVLQNMGDILKAEHVTHVCSTPSLWSLVAGRAEDYPDLAVLSLGGEPMPQAIADAWAPAASAAGGATRLTLYNVYGVTEATVYQAYQAITKEDPCRRIIGRPLPGVTLHVLNEEGNEAAEGTLYIGGPSVSHGYVTRNDGEEHTGAFVQSRGHGRLYRTGDLCRRDEQGRIVLLGRSDGQVKVNGVRVELAEVEHAMRESRLVENACAYAEGPARLALQVILRAGPGPPAAGDEPVARMPAEFEFVLTEHARRRLPAGMVPRRFLWNRAAAFPATRSGKLDRGAVAAAGHLHGTGCGEHLDSTDCGEPLATELERLVAGVWRAVLDLPDGVDLHAGSDWHELGGDSLRAIVATRKLRAAVLGGGGGRGWEGRPVAEAGGDAALFLHTSALGGGGGGDDGVFGGDAECFMGMCEGGTYAPCMLVEHSGLRRYAAFLESNGAGVAGRVPEELRSIVRLGKAELLRALLDAGYPLPCEPGGGAPSLLHVAAGEGRTAVLELLLAAAKARGAGPQGTVHLTTGRGATPAHVAAAGGWDGCLGVLFREGTGPGVRDASRQTVLHYACRSGQPAVVSRTLAYAPSTLDARDAQFRTPLHWAVFHRHRAVVGLLLAAGAAVEFPPVPAGKVAHRTRLPLKSPGDMALANAAGGCEASAPILEALLGRGLFSVHKANPDLHSSRYALAEQLAGIGQGDLAQRVVEAVRTSQASFREAVINGAPPRLSHRPEF
ncbi:Nonribosomal peptide synthetase 7 [Diplonema papillatum]|nr:Nonribosomal peptide synthetase 7 [Diplonema papillatum]